MVCGIVGTCGQLSAGHPAGVIGCGPACKHFYAMTRLMLPKRTVFICSTYVNLDHGRAARRDDRPWPATAIRRFGGDSPGGPAVDSNFGTTMPLSRSRCGAAWISSRSSPRRDLEAEGAFARAKLECDAGPPWDHPKQPDRRSGKGGHSASCLGRGVEIDLGSR